MGDVGQAPGWKRPSNEGRGPVWRHRQPHRMGALLSRAGRRGRSDRGRRRSSPGGARMILLTGGTGHLGTELLPLLAARGIPVRVLTRDIERARRRLGPIPELVQADARYAGSLRSVFDDVDIVISAMTGFGPGGDGPRAIDYEANASLIRAAEAAGVRRFVLISMCGAAADHPMELMRMKHRAEQALRTSGLDWTIVRPNVFMELWVGIVGDPIAKAGKAVVFGRGDNPINFNSAADVARVVELALFDPRLSRTVMEVGGPENVTL